MLLITELNRRARYASGNDYKTPYGSQSKWRFVCAIVLTKYNSTIPCHRLEIYIFYRSVHCTLHPGQALSGSTVHAGVLDEDILYNFIYRSVLAICNFYRRGLQRQFQFLLYLLAEDIGMLVFSLRTLNMIQAILLSTERATVLAEDNIRRGPALLPVLCLLRCRPTEAAILRCRFCKSI